MISCAASRLENAQMLPSAGCCAIVIVDCVRFVANGVGIVIGNVTVQLPAELRSAKPPSTQPSRMEQGRGISSFHATITAPLFRRIMDLGFERLLPHHPAGTRVAEVGSA